MLNCWLPRIILPVVVLCSSSPAEEEAQWFKGNTHAHSLWSDGDDFAENIIHWYHSNQYHFAVLSDHNVLHEGEKWMSEKRAAKAMVKAARLFGEDWVETREVKGVTEARLRRPEEYRERFEADGRFLIVQAEEISASYLDPVRKKRLPVHLNAVNLGERILPINAGPSIQEVLRQNLQSIAKQEERLGRPILGHLNHPNFSWAFTAEDLGRVVEERFFEVYNGHPGINHMGSTNRPGDEAIWDIANAIRIGELKAPALLGVATDDGHHYHGGSASPGRGWIMVRAKELTPEALILAMRAGDFYASSGVTLSDVSYDAASRTVRVAVAEQGDATFTAQLIGTRKGGTPGEVFAEALGRDLSFTIPDDALYGRVMIQSSRPHPNASFKGQMEKAWTQPVAW